MRKSCAQYPDHCMEEQKGALPFSSQGWQKILVAAIGSAGIFVSVVDSRGCALFVISTQRPGSINKH
jgi:hypothetical protein